jgi:hypothetical protein
MFRHTVAYLHEKYITSIAYANSVALSWTVQGIGHRPTKRHPSSACDMTNSKPPVHDDTILERRRHDRRRFSLRSLFGALFTLRRRRSRRKDDHLNTYIDWYEPWPLAASVVIILLSSLDAFLTLILLNHGAVELNMLMDWLIKMDIRTFAAVKLAVTGLALIVLVLHFNFHLYKVLPVRYVMYALMPLYALLIAHEIILLGDLPP